MPPDAVVYRSAPVKPASRIRRKNQQIILKAAEDEFARHGYKGTSMNAIAQRAGLPKANLHYYFSNKQSLYIALLGSIIDQWEDAFSQLQVDDDPASALAAYIRTKMAFSRSHPQASRIFAMEIISGGEYMSQHFNQDYRQWFQGRKAVFQAWVDAGKIDPIDPAHLIFMLWSSTQHYADFASHICQLTGRSQLSRQDMELAGDNLVSIILKGCGLRPPGL
ncbi:TetR/AcrR family transcriptional regulator [Pseudomonas sp. DTU_2021_1001937_2_SI_NGA_ILE_001]|uniref:TetR/AcrR family transcriptional regulator n=1 Tax=Pseudomonas sp. DTU_2021_1001937_2_SI_NGA_ILE_001 TaxID=3077589 RepID=UPI0028FC2988|nr:TetR/AcrR family transcriptional regulator [Pseudomonas sp. DTU_2021_1001937_2_SI_NGA_ILE_001]WNW12011.1 TetR/AcrR family transcriptional regulator [Pseudomonas sp. DTU_2021_1001937_2_SI_NGA_ILE_001]